MTDLRFYYDPVIAELDSFVQTLEQFLSSDSSPATAMSENLRHAQEQVEPGESFLWLIGNPLAHGVARRPIKTILSSRARERREWDGVYAEYFMKWTLKQGPKNRKSNPDHFFIRHASTLFRIMQPQDPDSVCLAQWNIDVGDGAGPGCKLHLQIPDSDIEIPRYPMPIVLPSDSLAFLMNELFPVSWPTHLSNNSTALFCGSKQAGRLESLLGDWTRAIRSNTANPFGAVARERAYSLLTR